MLLIVRILFIRYLDDSAADQNDWPADCSAVAHPAHSAAAHPAHPATAHPAHPAHLAADSAHGCEATTDLSSKYAPTRQPADNAPRGTYLLLPLSTLWAWASTLS